MIEIIRQVIEAVIENGYICNYIIGSREQISRDDAITFRFEMPRYRESKPDGSREYTLRYVVALPSDQESNDVQQMAAQLIHCDKINSLFMEKLQQWTNDNNQQLIQIPDKIDIREFADLEILGHPATGLLVEMRYNLLLPVECLWKV